MLFIFWHHNNLPISTITDTRSANKLQLVDLNARQGLILTHKLISFNPLFSKITSWLPGQLNLLIYMKEI